MTELVCFFLILYAMSASLSKPMQEAKKEVEETMKQEEVAPALISALPNFSERNRNAALNALLRDDARMLALLDAVEAGRIKAADLGDARVEKLKTATDKQVRERAERVLR